MTADATKLSQAWAESVMPAIAQLGDQALNDWILENRFRLADCARHAPGWKAKIDAALRARDLELRAQAIRQGIG